MEEKNSMRKVNYSCNICAYSMQNSTNRSMACEEETGPCDWFEPIDFSAEEENKDDS